MFASFSLAAVLFAAFSYSPFLRTVREPDSNGVFLLVDYLVIVIMHLGIV